jgi:hypothetical protein
VVNLRRLAAVDLVFLGPTIILAEFGLGVVGPLALGMLTLLRSHSATGTWFGAYLLSLSLNYVPMLAYAMDMTRHGTAHTEIAGELGDRKQLFRKYRRQSLLLLVPFAAPIIAAAQRKW